MPRASYRAPGQWVVVTDAGPAYKTGSRYAPQIVAFRIHRDGSQSVPRAEGAVYVGDTGINRAEYLAVIQGLHVVYDQMFVGEWERDPIHVVTDNAFVVRQAVGEWEADALGWYAERLNEICRELTSITDSDVFFAHAGSGESAGADTLARSFRSACDARHRQRWQRLRLVERWPAVRDYLRGHQHRIADAALAGAAVTAFDGTILTLTFRADRPMAQIEARKDELRAAIAAATGTTPRQIRCLRAT